jgi:DNA-binding helix-turn-helix protein
METSDRNPAGGLNGALAAVLRGERAAQRLSLDRLAASSQVSRRTLIRLLNAERSMGLEQAAAIAGALGLRLPDALERAEERLAAEGAASQSPERPREERPLSMQEIKQQRLLEAAMPVEIAADDRPWVGDGADDWEPC